MRKLLLFSLIWVASAAGAQNGGQSSSEAQLQLELARARIDERLAVETLQQKKTLASQGLLAGADLRHAEAEMARAHLETERAQVALANELPSFRVISATKSVRAGGQVWVDLRLRELPHMYVEGPRGYLVSLRGQTSIIAEPYQQQLTITPESGAERILSFRLLKDVDEVTVLVISGTRHEELPIFLQRSGSDHRLLITAQNFAQEGALGDKVDYVLQIERFSAGAENVQLVIQKLPADLAYDCIDGDTKAKLTLLRFSENQNSARIILRVYVPTQANPEWFGKLVPFRVEARDGELPLGGADLQIRPVGAPKLFLTTDNLLVHMSSEGSSRVVLHVGNSGGVAARDVSFDANTPVGFHAEFLPRTIPVLNPNEQAKVDLVLSAGNDAVPGEYNVKIQAQTTSKLANLESPEQSFRVVFGSTSLWTFAGFGLPIALTTGLAAWLWNRRRPRWTAAK